MRGCKGKGETEKKGESEIGKKQRTEKRKNRTLCTFALWRKNFI